MQGIFARMLNTNGQFLNAAFQAQPVHRQTINAIRRLPR